MPPGFLAVTSHPSSSLLPLAEFHAWYEEEHIPLRMDHLSEFLSGARYRAVDDDDPSPSPSHDDDGAPSPSHDDGAPAPSDHDDDPPAPTPTWLAMYEIDDTSTFAKPAYTSLRENRSARERGVMRRLEVLVRRTGEVLLPVGGGGGWDGADGVGGRGRSDDDDARRTRTTGMRPGRPSGWVVTHGVRIRARARRGAGAGEDEDTSMRRWSEGISHFAQNSSGWVRMRVNKVLESGVARFGAAVPAHGEAAHVMPYFVVHEFDDETSARSFRQTIVRARDLVVEAEPAVEMGEWRVWVLHKAYPSIAQGNITHSLTVAGF